MLLNRGRSTDVTPATGSHGPTFMTSEQVGQQPNITNIPFRSSPLKLFSSTSVPRSSKPEDSQKAWTAEFLTDLRTNRPARPNGSRPLPGRHANSTGALEPPTRTSSAMAKPFDTTLQNEGKITVVPERSSSAMSHRRIRSTMSMLGLAGRPLAQQPLPSIEVQDVSLATNNPEPTPVPMLHSQVQETPSILYFERGQRWMEKQEARSLRVALEDMDLQEEQRIHTAAQDEATDLVWKHRNPSAPYRNPDAPYNYRKHLKKGSHARSQSIERFASIGKAGDHGQRSVSCGSNSSKDNGSNSGGSRVSSGSSFGQSGAIAEEMIDPSAKNAIGHKLPKRHSLLDLKFPLPPLKLANKPRNGGQDSRKSSREAGQSLFRNPEDRIYEEPEEIVITENVSEESPEKPAPLKLKSRNTSGTFKGSDSTLERSATTPAVSEKRFSRYEIHKNPPSQSRNPAYVRNDPPSAPLNSASLGDEDAGRDSSLMRDSVERRSDDIRAATSMRLKDRSPKLPTPTAVSDRPGRPIVSFAHDYKPREVDLQHEQTNSSRPFSGESIPNGISGFVQKPALPVSTASAPLVPTIHISESATSNQSDIPTIPAINVPDIPAITIFPDDLPVTAPTAPISTRPLPTPKTVLQAPHGRPLPHKSATAPIPACNSHWSPALSRATAQCAACALPISGRVVTASSQRFHPACFTCFQCGELLECVAFYPEPDNFRFSRLSRIQTRLNNEPLPTDESHVTEEDDGDHGLRFYCHLDFHERFSPRCRSCKTPIEGEVVVACGGEWHVGHFFCAECGDPFDASTPFVEKDGFAWCVDCHCKRFSGKCAGCKRSITDMVIKALGREWHEKCFCCKECGGAFEDGRFFTRGESDQPVCVKCEEKRLKA